MAKLYFYYSTMNAGKSTILLQTAYNYRERGMRTLLMTPSLNTREGQGVIASRIGLRCEAITFESQDALDELCRREHSESAIACALLDEAQFLTQRQVRQLCRVVDELNVPVLTYGIRTDFQGNLFEGSQHLLAWADELREVRTICHCGKKATMVLRVDHTGRPIRSGEQIQIGGNESYVSVCRRHFHEGLAECGSPTLPFEDFNG